MGMLVGGTLGAEIFLSRASLVVLLGGIARLLCRMADVARRHQEQREPWGLDSAASD